jgi:hypothetical protein
MLMATAIEAVHQHGPLSSRNTAPCVFCVSVHSTALSVVRRPERPLLVAVARISVAVASEPLTEVFPLPLFIRPPPAI